MNYSKVKSSFRGRNVLKFAYCVKLNVGIWWYFYLFYSLCVNFLKTICVPEQIHVGLYHYAWLHVLDFKRFYDWIKIIVKVIRSIYVKRHVEKIKWDK